MPVDPTPVGTRLQRIVLETIAAERCLLSLDKGYKGTDLGKAIARALDDAGVRVFLEAAEVVVNATWPPSESDVIKLESALAALTGSKKTGDG